MSFYHEIKLISEVILGNSRNRNVLRIKSILSKRRNADKRSKEVKCEMVNVDVLFDNTSHQANSSLSSDQRTPLHYSA